MSAVDRYYRSTANAPGANADLHLVFNARACPDSQGSTILDLQQDQAYAQIVTGFVIAISLVLGLIVISVLVF